MLENLKLPLCPKCGDTKNVKDKNICYVQGVLHEPNYKCLSCSISWTPHGITDETNDKYYHCGGRSLINRTIRFFSPIKWWRTLTEDLYND